MPSFFIALSGLQANSVALNTIGNNLSNLNTTAYKKQDVNFSDMFYQSIGTTGANAPMQIGDGSRVSSVSSDFSQGSLLSTGQATDMAINGGGFFVVNAGGNQMLSRSGNFQLAPNGTLMTHDGNAVMGYQSLNGVVNTSAPLEVMNIPISASQLAKATSAFSFTTSLNSQASVGSDYTSSASMYDSQGVAHTVSARFTKTANNEWTFDVEMPSGDAATTSGNKGTLKFNPDGTLASPAADVAGITFGGLADGASDMNVTWNLRDSSGNSLLTQSAVASSTSSSAQDGHATGAYKSFAVDAAGVLTASFSSGGEEVLGQLAIATVTDPGVLSRNGSNLYSASGASGSLDIGVAGSGGRGTISGSTLEQSNVDISTEFSDLIVAQRSFEANSKTITAYDTITQDTINMIR